MNACVHAPTTMSEICGEPFLFSRLNTGGSSSCFAMSDVVSDGRMVNDSHDPSTATMSATLMNAPPQPGAMLSNTYSMAGLSSAPISA